MNARTIRREKALAAQRKQKRERAARIAELNAPARRAAALRPWSAAELELVPDAVEWIRVKSLKQDGICGVYIDWLTGDFALATDVDTLYGTDVCPAFLATARAGRVLMQRKTPHDRRAE